MKNLKSIIFLLVITSIISFFFQGKRGLWEPDEGRYAECAREMIITHDYIVPKLNLIPHLSKPPITYWAIALSMNIFGKSEFAVRLPNSIAFFLTVILIFLIGKNIYDFNTGLISSIIYATSIFPFIGLNFVTTDTILTFFIWLYIYFYFKDRYYLMSFSLGLAFLTKGPPALLPFLGIVVYNLIYNKIKINLKKFFLCLILFSITGLSWYILIIFKEPFAFSYFIKNEVIGRFKGIHHRNSGPFDWLMYIPIILLGLTPWIIIFKKRIFKNFRDDKLKVFYYIIGISFIVFCIAKSRLPLYVLPLMPAIALIIGRGAEISKNFYKLAIISMFFLVILRIIAVYVPYNKNDKQIYNDLKKIIVEKDFKLNFITTRVWNGLNFYFNTIPEYLCFSSRKLNRFCKETVIEKLKKIKNDKKNYFLISDKKKVEYFEKILNKRFKNLKYFKYKTKRFTVFRL